MKNKLLSIKFQTENKKSEKKDKWEMGLDAEQREILIAQFENQFAQKSEELTELIDDAIRSL